MFLTFRKFRFSMPKFKLNILMNNKNVGYNQSQIIPPPDKYDIDQAELLD